MYKTRQISTGLIYLFLMYTAVFSAAPTVTTNPPSNINSTGMNLNGSVDYNNGLKLTEYGFFWGTTSSSITTKIRVGTEPLFKGQISSPLTGRSPGSPVYYQAYATNSDGTGKGSVQYAKTDLPAPSISSGPTVSNVGANSVTVSWKTDINATGFIDYWVEGYAHDTKTLSTSSTSQSITLSGLSSGSTYKYQVSAIANGKTTYVTVSTFTTTAVLPAPSITSGPTVSNVGTNSVTVSWRTDINATGFIDYWVEGYAHDTKTLSTSSTSQSITLPGLSSGSTYKYQVSAIANGKTTYASVSAFTTTAALPAPNITSGPTVSNVGTNSVTVSWRTDINATGFIDYWVEGYAHDTKTLSTSSTSQSITLSGLSSGSTYKYQVSAIANGKTTYATLNTFTTAVLPAPKITSGPTVSNIGPNSVTVSWNTDINATGFIDYWVEGYAHDTKTLSTSSTSQSITLSGLSSAGTYKYQVSAIANGKTTYASVSAFTTIAALPAPNITSGPSVSNIGPNSVTVSWNTNINATGFIDYWVEGYAHDTKTLSTSSTSQLITLSALSPGSTYKYQVSAIANGKTTYSALSTFTTTAVLPAPNITSGPSVSNIGPNSITVSWKTDINATGFIDYWVEGYAHDTKTLSTSSTSQSITLTGLSSGSTYKYQVSAIANGKTTYAAVSSFATQAVPAPAVTTNPPSAINQNGMTINGSIDLNNGYALTEYGFYWGYSSSSISNKVVIGTTATFKGNISFQIKDQNPGITIFFQTFAKNSYTEGKGFTQSGTTLTTGTEFVFNGKNYSIIDNSMSWDEAKAYCESRGGHLLTITSQEEQNFIKTVLKNGTKQYYWLGLYQLPGSSEPGGGWTWVTGEPLSFTNWHPRQPDNCYGDDAGVILKDLNWDRQPAAGLWGDDTRAGFTNRSLYGFVCEWEKLAEIIPGKYYLTDLVGKNNGIINWDPNTSIATATVNHTTNRYNISRWAVSGKPGIEIYNNKIVMSMDAFNKEFYSVLPGEAYLADLASSGNITWNEAEKTAVVVLNGIQKQYKQTDCKIVDNKIVVLKDDFDYDFNLDLADGEAYLRKLVDKYPGVTISYDEKMNVTKVSYESRTKEYRIGTPNVKLANNRIVVKSDELEYLVNQQTPVVEAVVNGITKNSITLRVVFPIDGMYGNRLAAYDVANNYACQTAQPDLYLNHGYFTFNKLTPGGIADIFMSWHDGVKWNSKHFYFNMQPDIPEVYAKSTGDDGISVTVKYPLTGNGGNRLLLYNGNGGSYVKDISGSTNTKNGTYCITGLISDNKYEVRMKWIENGVEKSKSAFSIAGEKLKFINKITGAQREVTRSQLPLSSEWVSGNTLVQMYSARDGHPFSFGADYMSTAKTVNWLCEGDKIWMYNAYGDSQKVAAPLIASKRKNLERFTKFDEVVMKKDEYFTNVYANSIRSRLNEGYSFVSLQYNSFEIKPYVYNASIHMAQIFLDSLNHYRIGDLFDLGKYGKDGIWTEGGYTFKALKKFQKENNLPPSGKLDPLTYAVLEYTVKKFTDLVADQNLKTEIETQQEAYKNNDSVEKPVPNRYTITNDPSYTDQRCIAGRAYARELLQNIINGYVATGFGDPTYFPSIKAKAEGEIASYRFKYSAGDFLFQCGCVADAYLIIQLGPAASVMQKVIMTGKIAAVSILEYNNITDPTPNTLSDLGGLVGDQIEALVSRTRGAAIAFAQYTYVMNSDYKFLIAPYHVPLFNEVSSFRNDIKNTIAEVKEMDFSKTYKNDADETVYKNSILSYLEKIDRMNNSDYETEKANYEAELEDIENSMNNMDVNEIIKINDYLNSTYTNSN